MNNIFVRNKSQQGRVYISQGEGQKNTLKETTDLMYQTFQDLKNEGNTQFNSTFREKPLVLTTAEAQRWKEYNNYELKDHKNLTKEALKTEINNMTHKIALAREAKLKATTGTTYGALNMTSYGNWKVPEIEQVNRSFNEASRFYNTHKDQRIHGLRYIPPPVAENIQQLIDEQMAAELKNPNFLTNSRYKNGERPSSQQGIDKVLEETNSIIRMLNKDGKNSYQNKDKQQFKSVFNNAYEKNSFNQAKLKNKIKSQIEQQQNIQDEKYVNDQIQRTVKLVGQKGFFFPRRKRFNENLNDEILSQRAEKLILNNQNLNQKILEGDKQSKYSHQSHQKNLTVSELSKYFKQKKISEDVTAGGGSSRISQSQHKQRTILNSGNGQFRFTKKQVDNVNKRYAASLASSYVGALITGTHTRKGQSQQEQKEEEEQEVDIMNSDQEKDILSNEEAQADVKNGQDDDQQYEQITFNEDNESQFFNYLKDNYQTQKAENDVLTEATSAAESIHSGIASTIISRKCKEFHEKIQKEKEYRQSLEKKIQNLQLKIQQNEKQIGMQMSNDKNLKMMILDQRNVIQSGVNYTTHPQI